MRHTRTRKKIDQSRAPDAGNRDNGIPHAGFD